MTGAMWAGVIGVPTMGTGATDGLYLRNAGIPTYGTEGIFYEIDDNRAHGRAERVGVKQYFEGLEFQYRLIKALASDASTRHPSAWHEHHERVLPPSDIAPCRGSRFGRGHRAARRICPGSTAIPMCWRRCAKMPRIFPVVMPRVWWRPPLKPKSLRCCERHPRACRSGRSHRCPAQRR